MRVRKRAEIRGQCAGWLVVLATEDVVRQAGRHADRCGTCFVERSQISRARARSRALERYVSAGQSTDIPNDHDAQLILRVLLYEVSILLPHDDCAIYAQCCALRCIEALGEAARGSLMVERSEGNKALSPAGILRDVGATRAHNAGTASLAPVRTRRPALDSPRAEFRGSYGPGATGGRRRACRRLKAVDHPLADYALQLILDTPTRRYGASLRTMRAISRVPLV